MKSLLLICLLFVNISIFATAKHDIVYYYNNAQYQKAIDFANKKVITAKPDFIIWYYKGLSEMALCKYPDAEKSFKNAIKEDSLSVPALLSLAKTYEIAGNTENALNNYSKILKTDSTNIVAKTKSASIYIKKKKYSKAAFLYSDLIKQDSLNGWFYGQYAYCLGKLALVRESDKYYKKAIKLAPENKTIVVRMIRQLILNKRYETADKYIDTFLLRFPDDMFLLKQKAFIAAFGGNYLDAIRQFKYITELGDSSLFTLKYYGQSLYNNCDYSDAIFWLSRYVKINLNDTKNQYILALAYQKDYKYKESLNSFDLVFEQIYDTDLISDVFVEKANTFSAYGDYLKYRDSTKTKSKKKYKAALDNYLKAKELNPSNNDINRMIAVLYETKIKNDRLALYYYKKYYQNLDAKKTNEYQLAWIQEKITELTEKLHFAVEQ